MSSVYIARGDWCQIATNIDDYRDDAESDNVNKYATIPAVRQTVPVFTTRPIAYLPLIGLP